MGRGVIFVYLPVEGRYFDDRTRREHDWVRERVLAIVDDLHLPLVDLHPAFSGTPDISLLYAYHGGHFSPAGNRPVADAILEALRRPKAN